MMGRFKSMGLYAKGAAAALSGLLLWAAFPPQAQAESAWMARVPLFLLVRRSCPKAAAGWAWLAGLVFWVATLSWFPAIIKNGGPWPLVLLGQVGLAAWCAAFLAGFAYASCAVWRWAGSGPGWRRVAAVAVADPLLWAGTEVLRGWLLSGFAWNFLGVSQVANLPLIQVASVTGVYGVSAVLVMVNGAVASVAERTAAPLLARLGMGGLPRPERWAGRLAQSLESALPLVAVVCCFYWGTWRVAESHRQKTAPWRVALIQPNTPCVFLRGDDDVRAQVELLLNQTRLAGAGRPDLAVWPETATMGTVSNNEDTPQLIRAGAAAAGAPLLTGTSEIEETAVSSAAPKGMFFYNAAWLFSATGEAMGRYRKRHLVPFGEYIPLDKTVPILQRLAPTGVSCTAGRGPGVLHLTRGPGEDLAMGPLICFEDTVPALSRSAVAAGARLLVLMTNDAWFNGSIEPVQHLNQSIFRAVENGVPLVRAANSGVSCMVDMAGRVTCLGEKGEMADFAGFLVRQVEVPEVPLPAPYTRWGDWTLGYPGLALLLAVGAAAVFQSRQDGAKPVTVKSFSGDHLYERFASSH
ncbi:MAG: apolipoprotein N-acyltransferase [Verrucomicrobiota bacterium]|jgi:apolipoprotein N-acyltransferase|nr:apolipoprotein N-acyltransferase [Verrucomicrobiota bacterium]